MVIKITFWKGKLVWRDHIQSCGLESESGLRAWELWDYSWDPPWTTLDHCRQSQGHVRNSNSYFVILRVLKAQRQYPQIHFPWSSWTWCSLSPPLASHCSISVISMVTRVESSFCLILLSVLGFYWYFSCLFNLCNLSSSSALCRKVLQACRTHWVRIILFSVCFEPASAFMSWLTVLRHWTILPSSSSGWKFYRPISQLSQAISPPHLQVAKIISMPFFSTLVALSRLLPV